MRRVLWKLVAGLRAAFPERRLKRLVGDRAAMHTTTSLSERLFLYEQACLVLSTGRIAEIGSYLGATAVILAEALRRHSPRPGKLYCIDTWRNDAMSEGKRDTRRAFDSAIAPWKSLILAIEGNSREVELPCEDLFDLVFVDADHTYEGVRADVDRFAPLVRDGGRLVLHDHQLYAGPAIVVGELLAGGGWYIEGAKDNIIALTRLSDRAPRRQAVSSFAVGVPA